MTPNLIIHCLGGTAEVARICEVEPQAVSQWKKNGIPKARLMFLRLAKPEVFEKLDEMSGVENEQKAAA